MDAAKMMNFETVYDWLRQVATGQHGLESIHLDVLEGGKCSQFAGIELILYVQEVLLSATFQLRTSFAGLGFRQVVVFLPVDVTEELGHWTPDVRNGLICANEPPSLYLIHDEQVFNDDCEEYRLPVLIPIENCHGLKAVYRSFRDQEAIDNSWEFDNGVYLIARL